MVMLRYKNLEHYSMDGYLYKNFRAAREIVEKKKQTLVICNDGKSGLGKTTLSFQEAYFFARGDKKKFNQSHVLYNPEDCFEKITKSKKGDVWVFDEATVFNSRSAMTKYNKQMMYLLDTIRSKQIFIILNIPSFFNLDSNIVMDKLHLLVHLYGEHFGDKGKFMVFDDKKIKKLIIFGKKTYNYHVSKSNFRGVFSSKFLIDEDEYEKEKDSSIEKLMSEDNKSNEKTTRYKLQRDFLLSYLNQVDEISYAKTNDYLPKELKIAKADISKALSIVRNRYDPEWFKKRKLQPIEMPMS